MRIASAFLALLTLIAVGGCRKAESRSNAGRIAGQVAKGIESGIKEGARVVQGLQGPAAGGLTMGWKTAEGEETVSGAQTGLSVTNVSGPITVTGSDEDFLHVRYVKQAKSDADLEAFVIEVRAEGDGVVVQPVYGIASLGRFGSVELTISVPKRFARLSVSNVSGEIAVRELRGSAELSITNVSGATTFDLPRGSLSVKSTSGAIDGSFGPLDGAGARIESVSGKVSITAKALADAELDLRSLSGAVICELPVTVQEKSRSKLRGTLGSGGVRLTASTTSGAITVR